MAALLAGRFGAHLTGVFLTLREGLVRMNGWGRLISVASTAGLKGYAKVVPYAAAKHGVIGLTRSLALESTSGNSVWPVKGKVSSTGSAIMTTWPSAPREAISSANTPRGTQHLVLDSSVALTGFQGVLSAAELTVNLAGRSNVALEY